MRLNPKIAKGLKKTGFKLKKSSPTILTVISVGGVVATAVLSAKAAPKAVKLVEEGKKKEDMTDATKLEVIAVNIKYGWKPFIPAVATAAGTIACVLGSNILNKKQQAALTSAYMMLESQYRDYRKKVVERHGEEEDKQIIDSIIKDKLIQVNGESFDLNDEKLTFYEFHRDHYFEITMADFLYAVEAINRDLQFHDYVCLNEFYHYLGLDPIAEGWILGWSREFLECNIGVIPWLDIEWCKKTINDDFEYYDITYGMVSYPDYGSLEYISSMYDERPEAFVSHIQEELSQK